MLSAKTLESQTTLRLYPAVSHDEDRSAEDAQRCRYTLADGRYELETLLGVGGGGSVYRARDTRSDDWVAIKIMHPSQWSLPEQQRCFDKEVRLSRRVQHRNVARTFDTGESDGAYFMTMELIEGDSLRSLVRPEHSPPRLAQVLSIGVELCRGLAAIHAAGVVHCDLKPEKISPVENRPSCFPCRRRVRGDAHPAARSAARETEPTMDQPMADRSG